MKIMAIQRDSTACNYYRILVPLSHVDTQGLAEVYILSEADLHTDKAINTALMCDVLVFQRPSTEAWFKFIKTCQKFGKLVVCDYDDDPFNTSPLNPYYQYVGIEEVQWQWPDGTKEWLWSEGMTSASGKRIFDIERNIANRDMFRLSFKKADLVTCTTNNLREEFLKINPNVAVLPNCIDPDFFPKGLEFKKKEVRIGWQGGASHYEDLYIVRDAIKLVLEKNPSFKFIYFGDMRFEGMFKEINPNQIEFHSWINHSAYPYKLATLNLDIGLCPLEDNQFNRNKSSIKWMEYSALGIATIATNIPPYSIDITNDETGLLVDNNTEFWFDNIQRLGLDYKLRTKLSKQANDQVLTHHNIKTKAHLWIEAYSKLMNPEVKDVVHV